MNENQKILPTGKLPHSLLTKLINKHTSTLNDVVVGAKVGVDATVIDFGEKYLIAKTDPITFVTEDIGYYAININANDVACMGGIPRWFLATLLLPENQSSEELVEQIFTQIAAASREHNIAFCGGHTEITRGIDRPIVIGQMLGEVEKDKLLQASKAEIGDDILLTKGIAIEATSIIARQYHDVLVNDFSDDFVRQCKNFIYNPGISVLKEARIALQFEEIHAMHDPTEGGLAVGLYELAVASNVGLKINYDMIDIFPESKLLCDLYDLDPFGAMASGALLIVCKPAISHELLDALEKQNISAAKIGMIVPPEYGMKIISYDGVATDLPYFSQDEIVKLFN